ncbi:nucleotidyltransferase family protein [Salinactinospora qingdaonensis]|uniref:RelA/SpoT domain-containing protein n=1 Tax=Salinactinospora qingdaonensis TaxID=702744 RepID=A0ABP7EYR3_9ACTN
MQLPMSKAQIGRLGQRLIRSETPSEEDIAALRELLLVYSQMLAETVEFVTSRLELLPSSRTKTEETILEKLRRGGGRWLRDVQDLAGMRFVFEGDLKEQDRLVEQVSGLFIDCPKPVRVIDRRNEPSHGYRAVHVIAFPHGIPVEIQIRTLLQHEWAETFEKLADLAGRGIRYGDNPSHMVVHSASASLWIAAPVDDPRAPAMRAAAPPGSRLAIESMRELAALIADHEERCTERPDDVELSQATLEFQETLSTFKQMLIGLASSPPDE